MVVVGSPSRGLVGIGRGRGDAAPNAIDSAFQRAVLSMDHVNKFEGRTLWGVGKDLKAKWGSTTVILRGRPAGTYDIPSLIFGSPFRISPLSFVSSSAQVSDWQSPRLYTDY
jgi:ribosomal protein S5